MQAKRVEASISNPSKPTTKSRLPEGSVLFEKIVPAALVVLGLVTVALILFALAVLLGLIRF